MREPTLRITYPQLREAYVTKQMTMRDIADKWNMSLGAVCYHVNKAGIPRRKPGRRLTLPAAKRAHIIAMRRAGYSTTLIGSALRLDKNAVWRVMKDEGLTGKPRYRKRAGVNCADSMPAGH
jgi:transposase